MIMSKKKNLKKKKKKNPTQIFFPTTLFQSMPNQTNDKIGPGMEMLRMRINRKILITSTLVLATST